MYLLTPAGLPLNSSTMSVGDQSMHKGLLMPFYFSQRRSVIISGNMVLVMVFFSHPIFGSCKTLVIYRLQLEQTES